MIRDAARYNNVAIGIVPSEGDDPRIAKLIDFDTKRDLALLKVESGLNLPALTFVTNFDSESADVTAVGYPGVIEVILGNDQRDLIKPQKPTKGRGNVSQQRDVRGVFSVMHSAAIAKGNSGGPLLDDCGRVVGVNAQGTLSKASEAEFLFAIANRETLSFLRRNEVTPKTSDLPCRSLAEIEAEEAERARVAADKAEAEQEARDAETQQQRERIEAQIMEERENMMAVAAVLLLLAAGGAALSWQASQAEDGKTRAVIFGSIGAIAALGAIFAWIQRPGLSDVDERLSGNAEADPLLSGPANKLQAGMLTCTLDTERSRVTSAPPRDIEFEWQAEGCHQDTQYEQRGGEWQRIFVPTEDYMIRVATIDPEAGEFRNERYLVPRADWQKARDTRMNYTPPKCGAIDASTRLGDMQRSVFALLPDQPNERLVYKCEAKGE